MSTENELMHNLPLFSQIKTEKIEAMLSQRMQDNLEAISALLKTIGTQEKTGGIELCFESLILPLQQLDNELAKIFSPIRHLHAVKDTPELRKAYNAILPKLTAYQTQLSLNQDLYQAYHRILSHPDFARLSLEQQQIIVYAVRDFKLSGVALAKDEKLIYAQLMQKLAQLQTQFEQNVLDSTDNWHHDIESAEAENSLSGIPERAKEAAKARGQKAGITGFRFGLDYPSYSAVMTFADNRALRQIFYEAYNTRASEVGPHAGKWDNSPILSEIIQTRQALAKVLGFEHFAAYSLATKMVKKPEQVMQFLSDLALKIKPMAQKEYEAMKAYARAHLNIDKLECWDIIYVSEKMREAEFKVSQEALRPYFPEPKVMSGLFELVQKLYPIHIQEKHEVDTWDPAVRFFEIRSALSDSVIGQFYVDLYARPSKRGGAWMDECRSRFKQGAELQVPVAYLTCNFSGPVGANPALFTHQEVVTLFHEFGHGLHHLLTQVDYLAISGISGVAWDAVEVPSQFLENWCWEEEGLALISSHYQTHEPLPKAMLDQLMAAKNFQAGLVILRQVEFGLFDFLLHQRTEANLLTAKAIVDLNNQIRTEYGVIPVPAYHRFAHSFGHIFAGGYAAGYYSYLWAEVMACDAFSRFESEGIFNPKTGADFLKHILSKGGSAEFGQLFFNFMGREPNQVAFLKHKGIA